MHCCVVCEHCFLKPQASAQASGAGGEHWTASQPRTHGAARPSQMQGEAPHRQCNISRCGNRAHHTDHKNSRCHWMLTCLVLQPLALATTSTCCTVLRVSIVIIKLCQNAALLIRRHRRTRMAPVLKQLEKNHQPLKFEFLHAAPTVWSAMRL